MNSLFITKQLKSNFENIFTLKIFSNNNEIQIIIEKKGNFIIEEYSLNLSLEEIHKKNDYFKLFPTLEDILNELNERINSSVTLIEEKEDLLLTIRIPTYQKLQIGFTITKNENNSIDIFQTIESFNLKIQNLDNEIKKLKKENSTIKEECNKLLKENTTLKLEKLQLNLLYEKIVKQFNEIKMNLFKKNNFHWINDEVIISKSSEFMSNFPVDIVLNKQPEKSYCLTKGKKDHFIEFSFQRIYYLKSIRILISDSESSLKLFNIDIFDGDEKKEEMGLFIREKFSDNNGFQEFSIERVCKKVLLSLKDNWGTGAGDYILINRIDFNVSD